MLFNVNWNCVLADISLLISNIINTVFIVLGNLKRAFYWSVQLYSSLCGALLVSDAVCLLATPGTWLKLAGISPTFGYFLGLLFTDCLQFPQLKACILYTFQIYLVFQGLWWWVLLWDLDTFFFLRGSLKVPCSKVSGILIEHFICLCAECFYICFLISFVGLKLLGERKQ